jgi:hypothetical protein
MDVSLAIDFNSNEPKFPSYHNLEDIKPIYLMLQWHILLVAYVFRTYNKPKCIKPMHNE